MAHPAFDEIFQLPVEEKIRLVEDLWNSIRPEEHAELVLTEEQQRQFDAAVDDFERDPDGGIPWEDVKAEILARHRRPE
jgi:putative addiction module component (TIGR02574 family)